MAERWISVDDAAAYLGVRKDSIYRWIEHRGLPARKIGKLWKLKLTEVDSWVQTGGRAVGATAEVDGLSTTTEGHSALARIGPYSLEPAEGARGEPMSRDVTRPTKELLHELDQEKQERRRVAAQAEADRRSANAVDRLASAAFACQGLDDFLAELLAIFIDLFPVDLGVFWLCEADQLYLRASFGIDEAAVSEGLAIPFDERSPEWAGWKSGDVALLSATTGDPIGQSELLRGEAVERLYRLPLGQDGRLLAILYLGARAARELSDEDVRLFALLAARAGAAIQHHQGQENLRQAIRSRDEVLSVVAHDLRNPINVISLAANTLLQRFSDSSARRPVERIIRGAHRAERLVRDLLEVNAIESGQLTLERHRVEPANLVFAALESQQSLAAEASIIIAPDLSPELPPIEADEERLLEVLENLIGNAVKFGSPGGSIAVGASHEGGEILLWVKDSGAGISKEQLPHIFDRFWQARRTERRGTGLGLTICKGIVEAHGGRIWAESALGVGTTMFFTIPATPARGGEIPAVDVANILLVDDRPENLISLTAILERPDYRLVTASSGEEALSLALREQFSVALIDVAMPGMNGLDVAVHLKELERSRDIPIIFITAFGEDPEEIHRAYSAGGADYLVKPLDTEIVRKKVAVFVDLSRKRRVGVGRRRAGTRH